MGATPAGHDRREQHAAGCRASRTSLSEALVWPVSSGCARSRPTAHLGLGKLYGRVGKREQAREHLTTATTMYREMDMRFYLEQAETAMASDRPIVGQTDGP